MIHTLPSAGQERPADRTSPLAPLSATRPGRGAPLARGASRALLATVILAVVAWGTRHWLWSGAEPELELTATVARSDLPVTVTERGDIESAKTVEVRCEVEGEQIKIVEIIPEGTQVTAGQVVIRFDTDKLGRSHAEQAIKARTAKAKAEAAREDLEVQRNKAASEIAKARLNLELSELDLNKYVSGDYAQERRTIDGEILIAEEELKTARNRLESSQRLLRKGYISHGEVEADRLTVVKSGNTRDLAREKLRLLEEFSRKRQLAELRAGAEEAARELERTGRSQAALTAKLESDYESGVETAEMERAQMERLRAQLDNCAVLAPQDGILVYNKERPWDPNSRVAAGAVVHFQQVLFSLPDLGDMQVKVKIHESAVKKVRPGHEAEIRVDAYPDRVLRGRVEKISILADSRGWWDQRGVKEYETILKIEDLPEDAGLKPGMTAEVKILVNHLEDALIVPVSAVAEREGEHFSYVVSGRGVERRAVSVGETNDKHVEIRGGLAEGDHVALDARARIEAEVGVVGGDRNGRPPAAEPPSTGAAPLAVSGL